MSNKRILLMHISKVSGHRSASIAIEKAIKILEPEAIVRNIDIFNYTNPILTSIVNYIYMHIIQRTPFIWKYLYDNQKVIRGTEGLKKAIHNFNAPKLKSIIDNLKPGVVACSQAFPCGIVADLKKIYNLNIPLVAILTDYVPHSYWIYDTVDYYITPSEEVRQRLIDKGIEASRIRSFGIPIDPNFNLKINREDIKLRLGLRLDLPVILIMGGSHGLGPIKKVIDALDKSSLKFQEIIVTGINKKLFRYLETHIRRYKKYIKLYGYTDNVHELMTVSDIIITKPGGVTISEALVKGLPIVILKPIPGQEDNNTLYLVKHDAAIKINDIKQIVGLIEGLLTNPDKLKQLSYAALKMSNPNASMDIAKLLLALCNN